jgi:hypothetical protein
MPSGNARASVSEVIEAIIIGLGLKFLECFLCYLMGSRVGRKNLWWWGFFIGWVGVIVVAVKTRNLTIRPLKARTRRGPLSLEDEELNAAQLELAGHASVDFESRVIFC